MLELYRKWSVTSTQMKTMLYTWTSRQLVDALAVLKIYTVGTIKKNTKEFPDELKSITPPKGLYNSCSSGANNYFVFHDHKVVSFVTNVFPQFPQIFQFYKVCKFTTFC